MLKEFDFEDIYIRHGIDENPEPVNHSMHLHSRCEIFFFISGHVDYLVEGSRYPLLPNSLLIMRPSESHTARILDGFRYERYAINFPLSFLKENDGGNFLNRPFLNRPLGKKNLFTENDLDMVLVKKLFGEMICDADFAERKMILHTHLGMLLFLIFQSFSAKRIRGKNPQRLSEKIISYINAHLFEELSVSNLSDYFNLSSSQFTRIFKKEVGAAPWEYILKKRLLNARQLLKNGFSTQVACEKSGFFDYSAFYRSYTKCFKESPGETRKG